MLKLTKLALPILLFALSSATFAADKETFELKDGGKVVISEDNSMEHYNAAGKRVRMEDSKVMEAKDGSQLMMKNNAIWKTITEKGTFNPNR